MKSNHRVLKEFIVGLVIGMLLVGTLYWLSVTHPCTKTKKECFDDANTAFIMLMSS